MRSSRLSKSSAGVGGVADISGVDSRAPVAASVVTTCSPIVIEGTTISYAVILQLILLYRLVFSHGPTTPTCVLTPVAYLTMTTVHVSVVFEVAPDTSASQYQLPALTYT